MIQRINLHTPYQKSMKCIEEYEKKWKTSFEWLNEVLEQAKKSLSLPEQYLLPKTPSQNRKRQRCALPAISEDKESEDPPSCKRSCIVKTDQNPSTNSLVGNNINSQRIEPVETSQTETVSPRKTRRQKQFQLDKNTDGTLVQVNSLQTTHEISKEVENNKVASQHELKKGNTDGELAVKPTKISYKTRSKKAAVKEITEEKGGRKKKIDETSQNPFKNSSNKPLPTTPVMCSKIFPTTPSVKCRVQAYEETIKLASTPGISQSASFAGSPKKKLKQDATETVHTEKCALPSQQSNHVNLKVIIKRISGLRESHGRSSLVINKPVACKVSVRKSQTHQRKSKGSSENATSNKEVNSANAVTPRSSIRKSNQDMTPVIVLEKLEKSCIEEKTKGKTPNDDDDDDNYSDISTPCNSAPRTPATAPVRKLEACSLPKIGQTFTPCTSASSTGAFRQYHISRISKVPRTPQQGLAYLNQSSVISRVLSLREQMASKDREKHLQEEIERKRKKEEEAKRKKENLLKAKVEEKKRKREERMRKVSETRNRLMQEKDRKRVLEMTKEERAAQKGAELKERKLQMLQQKQMTRKQKLAEIEERRKKEENRLQKVKEKKEMQELEKQKLQATKEKPKLIQLQTPISQTSIQKKALYNSYLAKANKEQDKLTSSEEKENEPKKNDQILNTTYEKKEENCESYEMTPARSKVPSPADSPENYGIDEIKSDDETDDESAPKKKVPSWAQGMLLRTCLLQQVCNPPDVDLIFGNIETPDLTKIFAIQRKRFQKRTSSAVWQHKSFLTP